jgi:hypothetical protein
MDAILTYNTSTGKIQSLTPGLDVKYFLNTQTVNVKSFAPVFDGNGVEIGTREIDIYDPIMGDYVKVKKELEEGLSVAIISTKTREELLEKDVPEYEYPSSPYHVIDKDGNITETIHLWLPPRIETERKGFDSSGQMIIGEKRRKILFGYDYITILTQDEQNFDFSEHLEGDDKDKQLNLTKVFFDLHENYTITNNSLVKNSANTDSIVEK